MTPDVPIAQTETYRLSPPPKPEFASDCDECNSETDVSRGALAGKGDDIVRDGDFSTIGVGE